MTKARSALIFAAALGCIGPVALTAGAEEVKLPLGQQGEQTVARPAHGINKAQVEAVYGEPLSKHGPTGEPPIYHWEYPDYTVYFEGDIVLHSVLKHEPASSG